MGYGVLKMVHYNEVNGVEMTPENQKKYAKKAPEEPKEVQKKELKK